MAADNSPKTFPAPFTAQRYDTLDLAAGILQQDFTGHIPDRTFGVPLQKTEQWTFVPIQNSEEFVSLDV